MAAVFVLGGLVTLGFAQTDRNLAIELGYPEDSKLLIVHADDVGLAHSVNRATFSALERGLVSSAAVMVPCPWLQEVATWSKENPKMDLGIHLTLTSEWELYNWGPVAPRHSVASLIDPRGYFWDSIGQFRDRSRLQEVEAEARAQIELARSMGIQPTHLDSHMGTLFGSRDLLELYMRLGKELGIPVMLVRAMTNLLPFSRELLGPEDIVLDSFFMLQGSQRDRDFAEVYSEAIRNLKPGISIIIIHLGHDDDELRGICHNHPDYGSAWRQRDFDFFTSSACEQVLKENNVRLVTWREIGKLVEQP